MIYMTSKLMILTKTCKYLFSKYIKTNLHSKHLPFFSRSDEESFSETKIRLEDDEGYADDGQGKIFAIHFIATPTLLYISLCCVNYQMQLLRIG